MLWLPDREGRGFWAAAQMRPTTGPTAHVDDVVGTFIPPGRRPLIDAALAQERVVREGDPEWRDEVPVRVEAIPVRRGSRIIAVIGRNTNLLGVRTPSRLELSYLQTATDLTQMIARGQFPYPGQRSDHTDSPRVGDGFVRVDAAGAVTYASPNALSVYRQLGLATDLTGLDLAATTRSLVPPGQRADEETLSAVLGGRVPRDTEIGGGSRVVIARSIPLRDLEGHVGALVLFRDVTDLRSRDRELVTKDATIREIHHRVKNNLQTVAALLRLQARRMQVPEARAALEEAVRRVGSIALVHETLSQSLDEHVDFDEIADRLRTTVADVSSGVASSAGVITSSRTGSFGTVPGEVATALAMVLTELVQNAAEHAFPTGPGHVCGRRRASGRRVAGHRQRRRRGAAGRLRPRAVLEPGAVDRAHARRVRARGIHRHRRRPRRGDGGPPGGADPLRAGPAFRRPAVGARGPDGGSGGGAHPGAGVAALQCASLVLAHPAPDAVVLARLERPRETLLAHLAPTAHLLGLLDLEDGRTGVADREEQFRVLVEARGTVAPIHGDGSLSGSGVGGGAAGVAGHGSSSPLAVLVKPLALERPGDRTRVRGHCDDRAGARRVAGCPHDR